MLLMSQLFLSGLLRYAFAMKSNGNEDVHTLMATPTYTSSLTIAELEASYPTYFKALRILVRDGISQDKARRTVCWGRLATLHSCLPRQYRDPQHLFVLLQREQHAVLDSSDH
ncbi:MAG: DUF3136 domain-containing protein [bacterium]